MYIMFIIIYQKYKLTKGRNYLIDFEVQRYLKMHNLIIYKWKFVF